MIKKILVLLACLGVLTLGIGAIWLEQRHGRGTGFVSILGIFFLTMGIIGLFISAQSFKHDTMPEAASALPRKMSVGSRIFFTGIVLAIIAAISMSLNAMNY